MIPTQTESFVPLTSTISSSSEYTEFQATVISQPGEVQKFQSIAAPVAAPAPSHVENCQPQVSVQRDGNRVTGIRIQCSCGEVIELACTYEAAPAAQVVAPQPATIPPSTTAQSETGKICNEPRKEMPKSASKEPKVPEKGHGTSAAKRRST